MLAEQIIKKKKLNQQLSDEEIQFFINGYTREEIPDYQMSALLMAICLCGMTPAETATLTQVMLDSGKKLSFSGPVIAVDKHSTGGVGDKTSLILAAIVASCNVPVPMMSGRGLGHTGGTVDKLESIPGFKTHIDLTTFSNWVEKHNIAMISQTSDICPADKKIYGLRDVTGTVESIPLISASIMSKKIAEGIKGLVLDVKCGNGAFMKTQEDALSLAKSLIEIGQYHGLKVKALITDMSQPLGAYIGNALEVAESIGILKNEPVLGALPSEFSDCQELSIELASQMLSVAYPDQSLEDSRKNATEALESGKAFECFEKMVQRQGGHLSELPTANFTWTFESPQKGYLSGFHTEALGQIALNLGAGRKTLSDKIDPVAGLRVHIKRGQPLEKGSPLITIFSSKPLIQQQINQITRDLSKAINIGDVSPPTTPLILSSL